MEIHNPLSNEDIQNKVPCSFILYENMHTVSNISQLMPKTLILYQLAHTGHFCCIFENSEGIQFFDPLGYFPDDEIKIMPRNRRASLHHDYAYLDELLFNQSRPVVYNQYKLQDKDTSTCGHWCTIRMLYSDLKCDEFAECFKNIRDKDKLIVKLILYDKRTIIF